MPTANSAKPLVSKSSARLDNPAEKFINRQFGCSVSFCTTTLTALSHTSSSSPNIHNHGVSHTSKQRSMFALAPMLTGFLMILTLASGYWANNGSSVWSTAVCEPLSITTTTQSALNCGSNCATVRDKISLRSKVGIAIVSRGPPPLIDNADSASLDIVMASRTPVAFCRMAIPSVPTFHCLFASLVSRQRTSTSTVGYGQGSLSDPALVRGRVAS